MICSDCEGDVHDIVFLPAGTRGLLQRLLTSTLGALEAEPPSISDLPALSRVLEPFLAAQIERYESLRSLRMAEALTSTRRF